MSNEETSDIPVEIPLHYSTEQTDEDFVYQKYNAVLQDRSYYLGDEAEKYTSDDPVKLTSRLAEYYSLDELVSFLAKNTQFKNITLQFPDSLVMDSSYVSRYMSDKLNELNEQTPREVWILADTAYSACCVDEVAAEHVHGDVVVHFGDACLHAIQKLAVIYSFGKPYLDLDLVIERFKETFPNVDSKVCLMADAPFTTHVHTLYTKLLEGGYRNLIYATINDSLVGGNVTILGQEHNSSDNNGNADGIKAQRHLYTLDNRVLCSDNEIADFPSDKVDIETQLRNEFSLFHITVPQDARLLYLTTVFNSVHLYDTRSRTVSTGPFPSLTKRYRYMHIARTAGCIGILVNTLSLRNTKEMINSLVKLIRESGKKHYLFVVGKPNVAKLANFEPIDIWCVLGCSQGGIIIDQNNEFFKPAITPYELTVALNREVTWTGKWVVDFEQVLQDIERELAEKENEGGEQDSDAPEFDPVTGKYVSTSRPLRGLQHLELESSSSQERSLVGKVSGGVVIKGTVSTSAASLQSRSWTGLGSDFKDDEGFEEEGATVQEGISGIARGYQYDRQDAEAKQIQHK